MTLSHKEKRALATVKCWEVYLTDFFGDRHTNGQRYTRKTGRAQVQYLRKRMNRGGVVWMGSSYAGIHGVRLECNP